MLMVLTSSLSDKCIKHETLGQRHYHVIYMYIYVYWAIGLMIRVFANGPGDQGSIPG